MRIFNIVFKWGSPPVFAFPSGDRMETVPVENRIESIEVENRIELVPNESRMETVEE
jgi:hypothetical protein